MHPEEIDRVRMKGIIAARESRQDTINNNLERPWLEQIDADAAQRKEAERKNVGRKKTER